MTRFPALLLHEDTEGIVSLNLLDPSKPLVVHGSTLLDKGFIGVWFVSAREWHDIGAIYDPEKNFKGYYCDIVTPIRRVPNGYEMTDLFLDLWVFPNGEYLILDQDEFDKAVKKGWLNGRQIERAKAELQGLISMVEFKQFPPPTIKELLTLPKGVEEMMHRLEGVLRYGRTRIEGTKPAETN